MELIDGRLLDKVIQQMPREQKVDVRDQKSQDNDSSPEIGP